MIPVLVVTDRNTLVFGYSDHPGFKSLAENTVALKACHLSNVRSCLIKDTRSCYQTSTADPNVWASALAGLGPQDQAFIKFIVSPKAPRAIITGVIEVYEVSPDAVKHWESDEPSQVNPGLQMPTANVKDMMPVLAITQDGKMFFGYSGFTSFKALVDNAHDTESVYIHNVRTIVIRDYVLTPTRVIHIDSYWWAPFLANHGPSEEKLDDNTLKFLVSPSAPSSLIESIAQVYLVADQAAKAWELDTSP